MAWDIIDWFEKHILAWIFIILIAFVLIIIPLGIYHLATTETFSLTKSEWQCIDARQNTTYVKSGDVLIPITTNDCIEYKRIY